jgi:two-component sensor histidine kinase
MLRGRSTNSGFVLFGLKEAVPLVEPPTRRSFGTRMMESLGQQLNGQVQLAYEPAGSIYSLDVPLSSIIAA